MSVFLLYSRDTVRIRGWCESYWQTESHRSSLGLCKGNCWFVCMHFGGLYIFICPNPHFNVKLYSYIIRFLSVGLSSLENCIVNIKAGQHDSKKILSLIQRIFSLDFQSEGPYIMTQSNLRTTWEPKDFSQFFAPAGPHASQKYYFINS